LTGNCGSFIYSEVGILCVSFYIFVWIGPVPTSLVKKILQGILNTVMVDLKKLVVNCDKRILVFRERTCFCFFFSVLKSIRMHLRVIADSNGASYWKQTSWNCISTLLLFWLKFHAPFKNVFSSLWYLTPEFPM
jgi:hypothetical protein